MIELYSVTRNVAIEAYFTNASEFKAPDGWYFTDIVAVHGATAPFSCPQAITYRHTPEAIQQNVRPLRCTVPAMGFDIELTSSAIRVARYVPITSGKLGEDVFIVAKVHVSTDFEIAPLTRLAQEVADEVITSYWSIDQSSGTPSLRETYIPPLAPQETLDALFAQNEHLLRNGHELVVRFYRR